jgi:signal transduction histidine kinase/DNA-binding response OmpR family regulator
MVRYLKLFLAVVGCLFTVLILIAVYIVVGREMHERKRAELELACARDMAEAASRAKGDFMANVSHEIRTPMNAILGMTELTLDTELSSQQRENLSVVKSATECLLAIINDLLDFSKMEAGKLALDEEDFNLRDHLADVLGLLGLKAVDKGLELSYRVDPFVPDRLRGDPSRLRQILVNLVGNAVKFTEKGDVLVEVSADLGPERAIELHFRVTDTGIGIPPEKRELVFEPFTQADGSTTRIYGGTGLGLTISSQLVKLMGGRLWVESELGRGSTFHFTAKFFAQVWGEITEPASLSSLKGLRVLVVDDNAVNRRILEEILTYWEMNPTLVEGGQMAIHELQRARDAREPFSLVLLDAMMPDLDGFSVAEQIKSDSRLQTTVILMLTSSDRHGFVDLARSSGIAACLNKPIHQNKLLDAILEAFHGTPKAQPRLDSPVPSLPRDRPLRILMAEDNPHNQRVAMLILAKSGHTVTVAANGLEAVEALKRDSFDLVLMDLQMPLMDGLQATAAIREAEAGTSRRVPIIAMTAHAMREDQERCLAAGMDGYLSKPIQSSTILSKIQECLDRERPTHPTEPHRCETSESSPPMDLAGALDRVDGDRPFLVEMAKIFAAECPEQMEEIREALAERNGSGVLSNTHKLKNWSSNFLAESTFATVTRFEGLIRSGSFEAAGVVYHELKHRVEQLSEALRRLDPGAIDDDVTCRAIDNDPRSRACIP